MTYRYNLQTCKKCDEIINCYFNEKLDIAFRTSFNEASKIKHSMAWQYYFCWNYYCRKDKYDCHVENCTVRPGYVYHFNTQSLLTFEELFTFPLEINPITFNTDEKTMSYTDFIIFKEHNFLRNIFSRDKLAKIDSLKNLNTFHEKFVRFLKVAVFL